MGACLVPENEIHIFYTIPSTHPQSTLVVEEFSGELQSQTRNNQVLEKNDSIQE